MKRNSRPRRSVSPRDRRVASEVPAVPTAQPDPKKKQDEPAKAALEYDPAEEAARRMVEAAYT